jgi:hypothetical protein
MVTTDDWVLSLQGEDENEEEEESPELFLVGNSFARGLCANAGGHFFVE